MPTISITGGTIPVGSKIVDNIGYKNMFGAESLGNSTRSQKPPLTAALGVQRPAFAGQWYTVSDEDVVAQYNFDSELQVWRPASLFLVYDGGLMEPVDDMNVEYTSIADDSELYQARFGVVSRDGFIGRTLVGPVRVKLTPSTASFLTSHGYITQGDFDKVVERNTPTQKTVLEAVKSASNAIVIMSLVAAAVYFLPRFKGS